MSFAIGSTGCGSRITLNTGVNDAFIPVVVFILIVGNSVKLPAFNNLTPDILPNGSQTYDNCVPFAG